MKQFSDLTKNKNAILESCQSETDMIRFYCNDRLKKLLESNELNHRLQRVLQDCDNVDLKIQSIVETYVKENQHKSNDDILNGFDILSETIFENSNRFNECFSEFISTIKENPWQQHNINRKLQECYVINPTLMFEGLYNLGLKVGELIDVKNTLTECKITNTIVEHEIFNENPKELLSICESIKNSISFLISFDKVNESADKLSKLHENLVNIYNIYHEGVDMIESHENNALEFFNLFISGQNKLYDFQVAHLMKTLKNPATFCEIAINWVHLWILDKQPRLSYKFNGNEFIRLQNIITIFQKQHPIFVNAPTDVNFCTITRLLELMDILLSVSQMLRMDLRQLVITYINLSRPMIESYRDDLHMQRSRRY